MDRGFLDRTRAVSVAADASAEPYRSLPLPTLALFVLSFLVLASLASAAQPIDGALADHGYLTDEQREKAFQELEQDAALIDAQARVIRNIGKLLTPSVVHIEAKTSVGTVSHHSMARTEETGAGVIVEINGGDYVLTNRHVVNGASPSGVDIELSDGRVIHPTQIWGDASTDIAVLKVEAESLVPAETGDSDELGVGDFVVAIGSPFGLSSSVTSGIISATGRRNLDLGSGRVDLQDFLQTDAAINPGNSGGPLIDSRGRVIGIITAIASNSGGSEGIGFAIPINMFMQVAEQFVETGHVRRAFLGVTLDSQFTLAEAKSAGLPYAMGAKITRVVEGSPASKARLKVGDVVLKANDVPIDDDVHLVGFVNLCRVDQTLNLLIYRNRETIDVTVQVTAR